MSNDNMISGANEPIPPEHIDVPVVEFVLKGMASNMLGHMDACEELMEHKHHSTSPTETYLIALNLDHMGKSMDNLMRQMGVLQALIDNQATERDIIFRMNQALTNMKEKDNGDN